MKNNLFFTFKLQVKVDFYYRIIKIGRKMENIPCDSSSGMVKRQQIQSPKKSVKRNVMDPIQLLEKELDIEHGTTHYNKHETPQIIVVPTNTVFLPNQGANQTSQTLVHVKPVYSFGAFLQTVEILGSDQPSFSVQKIRSFPTGKFALIDNANPSNVFELTSNFIGTKYHLVKEGVTHLTISFKAGCGNICRHLDIFTLRDKSHWESLDGCSASSDLEELYPKGNNYEHISRLTNLQPSISRTTGNAVLKFSRKAVVPCVENMIICNLNGQRVMELIKINELDGIFEINLLRKMDMDKLLAILVASFDFKWGLE